MVEVFGGSSGWRRMSWREIQEMKKNMRKVPQIQKKSNDYHANQAKQAEAELNKAAELIKEWEEQAILIKNQTNPKPKSNKVILRFKQLFKNIK